MLSICYDLICLAEMDMPQVTENLQNARLLVDFSNLKASAPIGHPTHPDYFRNNHPEFAPKCWWDEPIEAWLNTQFQDREETDRSVIIKAYVQDAQERNVPVDVINARIRDLQSLKDPRKLTKQWQVTQASLREWWVQRFKDDIISLVKLLNSIFDPDPHTRASRTMEWAVRQMYPNGVPKSVTVKLPGRSITSSSTLREGYIPMQAAIVYLFEHPWRARFCAECNKRFVAAEPKNKFCSESCSHERRTRQLRESWHAHKHEWRPTQGNRQRRATHATKRRGIKALRKPHV